MNFHRNLSSLAYADLERLLVPKICFEVGLFWCCHIVAVYPGGGSSHCHAPVPQCPRGQRNYSAILPTNPELLPCPSLVCNVTLGKA